MIYSIKVPSTKLPIAAQFVHYLHHKQFGSELKNNGWHDQESEGLTDEFLEGTEEKLQDVLQSPAREHIRRALSVTSAMMAGNDLPMRQLIGEKEHLWIVGAPRTGGTYLLKEAMRAVGKDYTQAWGALYHDSFPPLTAFRSDPEPARSLKTVYGLAQYFVMASLEDGEVIPKKLHTLTAIPEFANKYLDNIYVTERHPMDACMSMLAKGGGMPADRRMPRNRTNIERQCWDMLMFHGEDPQEVRQMDYWDVYLRFWNLYKAEADQLKAKHVPYRSLPHVAKQIHEKYGSGHEPEPFKDTEYDRAVLHRGGTAGRSQPARKLGL